MNEDVTTATSKNRSDAWWRLRHGFDNILGQPSRHPRIEAYMDGRPGAFRLLVCSCVSEDVEAGEMVGICGSCGGARRVTAGFIRIVGWE